MNERVGTTLPVQACVAPSRQPPSGAVRARERTISGGSLPCSSCNVLAYAAGLFEGEGCISIGRSRLRSGMWQHWLTCSVQMGDPEPLEFLQSEWNGGIYRMAVKGNRRPQQTWRVNTRVAAAFLKDVAPYFLTARVARKAELALAFQAQKMNTGCRPSPEYLAAQEAFFVEMRRLNVRGINAVPGGIAV